MKQRLSALVLLAALACAVLVAPLSAAAAPRVAPAPAPTAPVDPNAIPVTGIITGIGTFTGTLDIARFAVRNGQLVAIGSLSGTLTDLLGQVIGTVTNVPITLPVTNISGTCQILHLELGPLDLNLLGLVVHLDKVVLDITAQSGSGNLLGNLLCAVAHLLDSNAALTNIARLLNRILALL
jgi:hypothetical protein